MVWDNKAAKALCTRVNSYQGIPAYFSSIRKRIVENMDDNNFSAVIEGIDYVSLNYKIDLSQVKIFIVYYQIPTILRTTHTTIHTNTITPLVGCLNKAMTPDLFGF